MSYCGIKKLKKGRHFGSMTECLDHNQVRYYGLHKIDPMLIKNQNQIVKVDRSKLINRRIVLRARIKNLQDKLNKPNIYKNVNRPETIAELKKAAIDFADVIQKIKQVDNNDQIIKKAIPTTIKNKNLIHCDVCDQNLAKGSLSRHIKTQKHKNNLKM